MSKCISLTIGMNQMRIASAVFGPAANLSVQIVEGYHNLLEVPPAKLLKKVRVWRSAKTSFFESKFTVPLQMSS